jgi:hypothetical protein
MQNEINYGIMKASNRISKENMGNQAICNTHKISAISTQQGDVQNHKSKVKAAVETLKTKKCQQHELMVSKSYRIHARSAQGSGNIGHNSRADQIWRYHIPLKYTPEARHEAVRFNVCPDVFRSCLGLMHSCHVSFPHF